MKSFLILIIAIDVINKVHSISQNIVWNAQLMVLNVLNVLKFYEAMELDVHLLVQKNMLVFNIYSKLPALMRYIFINYDYNLFILKLQQVSKQNYPMDKKFANCA